MRMQHPRPFLGREYVKQRLSALLVSAFLSLECSRTRCPPPSFLVIVRSKQRADVSYLPTFRTHFCVFENFLLETHTMDNLPANEGYRSHRMLDFARMGSSQETAIIHRYGPPCRRSTSQRARPDRPDITLKVQKRLQAATNNSGCARL